MTVVSKPVLSPQEAREAAIAKVVAALDKLAYGRITVIVQDKIPIRVEVTDQENI